MLNFSCCTQKRLISLGAYLKRMGRKNRNVNKFAQRKRDRREAVYNSLYKFNVHVFTLENLRYLFNFQEKNPQEKPAGDVRRNYEEIVRENAAFEEYYKVRFLFIYIKILGLICRPHFNAELSLQDLENCWLRSCFLTTHGRNLQFCITPIT